MTVKSTRTRLDRIESKVATNRGELIDIILIDTFTDNSIPDRIIQIKMYSKSGEVFANHDAVTPRPQPSHAAIPRNYKERDSLSKLY